MESRLSKLLLRVIDSYDGRNGTGPTVRELSADLGITPDFGHSQLVDLLRQEVSAGHVAHYAGRFSLTAPGRRLIEGDGLPEPAEQSQPDREDTMGKASLGLV